MLAGACGEAGDSASVATTVRPAPTVPVSKPLTTTTSVAVVGEVPESLLAAVIDDARGQVGAEQIRVIRAESTVWNDGALGCPRPGELYTQAIVDGYWVVLEAAGEELDYRLTVEGTFRLCKSTGPDPRP